MQEGKAIGKGKKRGRKNIVFVHAFQDESQVGLRLKNGDRRKRKKKSIEFSRSIGSSDRYPCALTQMKRRERMKTKRERIGSASLKALRREKVLSLRFVVALKPTKRSDSSELCSDEKMAAGAQGNLVVDERLIGVNRPRSLFIRDPILILQEREKEKRKDKWSSRKMV